MLTFLKENIMFFSFLGMFVAIYITLSIYSCGLDGDLKVAEAKRTASRNELQDELDRQANFNDVADNLKIAQQDSKDLANSRKAELSALRTILSKEGILADADRKSSQDVNSDLQRFIRLYREKLTQKGIKVKGSTSSNSSLGFPAEGDGKQESFGFAKYDGQWPSFEVAEAREIYKQKQIILRLLDLLIQAKGSNAAQPLELLSVKRELVGEEDSKRRDRDTLATESLGDSLVERPGKIQTYAFRIELVARTTTLRQFITLLEPPFIVSDVEVHRAQSATNEFAPSDGLLPPEEEVTTSIPIIVDVDSRFVITIEYLIGVQADPKQFLKTYYSQEDEEGNLKPPPQTTADFLSEHVFTMEAEAFGEILDSIYKKEE
jgi:hypothetical protein